MKSKRAKRIITPKHYQGIGEIIVTWARLEMHMLQTFKAMLGLSAYQTYVIFGQAQFADRMKKLQMLGNARFTQKERQLRGEFADLLREISDAYAIRNIPAHTIWRKGEAPDTIVPLYIKTKKGKIKTTKQRLKDPKEREFSSERLRDEAVKIFALAERFKEFSSLHFGAEFLHNAADDGFD